jgi:hypothetical protein
MRLLVPIFMCAALVISCGGDDDKGLELPNGEACEQGDCASGLCLEQLGEVEVPGGMCSDECMWGENPGDPDTCADGEVCLKYNPTNEYLCFQNCTAHADCREDEGYECMCLDFFCIAAACVPPL